MVDEQSYFEAADGPSALEHLWSLSIEEQFYLVFPLLAGSSSPAALGGGVFASCSALRCCRRCCAGCCTSPASTRRAVYFGTDTRRPPACCWVSPSGCSGRPTACGPTTTAGSRPTLDAVGLAGAAVLAWYALGLDEHRATAFRGGFTAAQVARWR